MRIFADVNIFLDVQRRRKNWNVSFSVLKSVVDGKNEGFISALTPVIIYFLRRQITSDAQARQDMEDAIAGFKIVDLAEPLIRAALDEKQIEDFEDSIRFISARQSNAVFITRNKKHFRKIAKEIELLSPEDFLKKYGN